MRSFLKRASAGAAICALSACADQTTIQQDYVVNRSECQLMAEANIERFMAPGERADIRARNAKLVTLFSDCMFEKGWTVATPEREDGQEFAQDDLGQLNDVPAGATAARRSRVPQQPAQPQAAQPIPAPSSRPQPLIDQNRRVPAQQYQQF